MKNTNKTKMKRETKRYLMKKDMKVTKNYGFGWGFDDSIPFFKGLHYETTDLKQDEDYPNKYFFQLYDNQGWIGDYRVDKKIWNDNVEEMDY